MKYWRFQTSVILVSLTIAACNYERSKLTVDPATTKSNGRFSTIQKTIVEPKCLSCHSANNPSDGINLSSYAEIMNSKTVIPGKPEESKFFLSVLSGKMPRGRAALDSSEIDLIKKWIQEGAHEVEVESGTPPPQGEAAQPSYQWIEKNIIQKKCLICHNTAKPRGKVDLSSYAALMASPGNKTKPVIAGNAEESTFFIELEEQKMPPTIKSLNAEEVKALYDWILAGAPAPVTTTPPVIVPSPTPGPTPTPGPPEPTYAWLSKNVLSRRCGSCHGIPFKIANVDFTTYDTLLNSVGKNGKPLVPSDPEQSAIYKEVVSGHMPPPRKTLSVEEIKVVKQWIEDGAKNN